MSDGQNGWDMDRLREYVQMARPYAPYAAIAAAVLIVPLFILYMIPVVLGWFAPPLDPQAASYYAVSPPPADWTPQEVRSFLEEYNSHMLKILTIHEAYPGHYVQLTYASQNPSLIRRVFGSGAYIEGWAVYGEVTMLNEGFGDGDLRLLSGDAHGFEVGGGRQSRLRTRWVADALPEREVAVNPEGHPAVNVGESEFV